MNIKSLTMVASITAIALAQIPRQSIPKQQPPVRFLDYYVECVLILPLHAGEIHGSCELDGEALEAYIGTDNAVHVRPKPGKVLYRLR